MEDRIYVPGGWKCEQCEFHVTKMILSAQDGTVVSDNREIQEMCPNDSHVLRRETWKERALSQEKTIWDLLVQLKQAKVGN